MNSESINDIVDSALTKGTIEAECENCGVSIECEISAKTAWCEVCEKMVRIKNPLITMGLQ